MRALATRGADVLKEAVLKSSQGGWKAPRGWRETHRVLACSSANGEGVGRGGILVGRPAGGGMGRGLSPKKSPAG